MKFFHCNFHYICCFHLSFHFNCYFHVRFHLLLMGTYFISLDCCIAYFITFAAQFLSQISFHFFYFPIGFHISFWIHYTFHFISYIFLFLWQTILCSACTSCNIDFINVYFIASLANLISIFYFILFTPLTDFIPLMFSSHISF